MATVAFWAPNTNQNGSTSIMAAAASALSLIYDYSTLMIGTNFMDYSLETSFINVKKLKERGTMDFSDVGIDALERLIKSGKLSAENLIDYTTPLLKGRLDLMFSSQKNDVATYNRVIDMLPNILHAASKKFDLILIDVKNGTDDEKMRGILESSDLIVVNINQSDYILNDFFRDKMNLDILKEKKFLLVIGRYDKFSKFNSKNITRFYHYKDKIFTLPYNTQFFDMQNDHRTLEFFVKYINVKPSDRNGFFVGEVKSLADAIVNNVTISTEE